MREVTLNDVRKWGSCYKLSDLEILHDKPYTLAEILTKTDGPWADVPSHDRIWVACRALPVLILERICCDCLEPEPLVKYVRENSPARRDIAESLEKDWSNRALRYLLLGCSADAVLQAHGDRPKQLEVFKRYVCET